MSDSRLMPLARTAVSSWSALNRPKTSSVAVSIPMGSAKTQAKGTSRAAASATTPKVTWPIDQQGEDLLQRVAQQQHKGEDHHGNEQRRQDLAHQVCVQCLHQGLIVGSLAQCAIEKVGAAAGGERVGRARKVPITHLRRCRRGGARRGGRAGRG